MHKIAVYGTLKKPYGNHRIIEDQEFIQDDLVEFSSIECCGFPMTKFDTGTDKWLKVEIYNVDDEAFKRCDSLEGNGHFYNRKEVTTKGGLKVWIYEIMRDIKDESQRFLEESNIYNWTRTGRSY